MSTPLCYSLQRFFSAHLALLDEMAYERWGCLGAFERRSLLFADSHLAEIRFAAARLVGNTFTAVELGENTFAAVVLVEMRRSAAYLNQFARSKRILNQLALTKPYLTQFNLSKRIPNQRAACLACEGEQRVTGRWHNCGEMNNA